MVKDVVHSIAAAAQRLFANWAALLISLSLYAALLGAIYFFFKIREATATQVALNLILPIAAVALFFMIQAMGLSYVRIGVGAGYLLKRSLEDCWRILLASLPLILIAWLIVYLFGKADQAFFIESGGAGSKSMVWGWGAVAAHAVQILMLHVLLPLIAIHLWIAAVRGGLAAAFKGFNRVVTRALAPRSLLIYAAICAVFGATVYFLLFQQATFTGPWTQLWAVGIKTALALLLTFIGWLLTLGSMAELTTRREMLEV
ncbi:MAG TPA: hypothetical protein VKG02_01205 [Blastocatellia bacterium]|nr:hypothetical protein [Blastocatellia bacterium]